jgi:CRP-like cAMP-binding protein
LTPLTRIQMVVHLQTVELFAHCTAEQVVRIAAIARQKILRKGEKIYAVNDAAEALYCLVEGEVVLGDEDRSSSTQGNIQGDRRVVSGSTFGVREILSGRLRAEDALATCDGIALEIEAEDFFDLLSNNIEIVKALFRQIMAPMSHGHAMTASGSTSILGTQPSLAPQGEPS